MSASERPRLNNPDIMLAFARYADITGSVSTTLSSAAALPF